MTAEEIIERLLDERHISAKEAMILLKAIIGYVGKNWWEHLDFPTIKPKQTEKGEKVTYPWDTGIAVAYGVQIPKSDDLINFTKLKLTEDTYSTTVINDPYLTTVNNDQINTKIKK